jgi:hypothetical protein
MTNHDCCSRLNRLIAELKMIPLLQRRLDDDTIDVDASPYTSPPRQGPRQGRTENFLYA